MEKPDTKQRAEQAGIEVRYLTPAETTQQLERDTVNWARAIKSANIKLD
jgi:tripartite-type tricarboxylate transporter receptor subunit TctC